MRAAEFEEKDFEGPLYCQLLCGSYNFATPGQVFEGKFGIDAALKVQNSVFWKNVGCPSPLKGVILDHFHWGFIWRKLRRKRFLPNFSVNVLIQAKRPDVLKGKRSDFVSLGIPGQYWRFFVTPHQQKILERVSRVLGNRALVVYASPAFDTLVDLYGYTQSGKIVEHSSFVKVGMMKNHNSWNYDKPGSVGIAASILESIEDDPVDRLISNLNENFDSNVDPRNELESLYKKLINVCKDESDTNPIAKYFLKREARMRETLDNIKHPEPELLSNYIGIVLFCDSVNVIWLPISPGKSDMIIQRKEKR